MNTVRTGLTIVGVVCICLVALVTATEAILGTDTVKIEWLGTDLIIVSFTTVTVVALVLVVFLSWIVSETERPTGGKETTTPSQFGAAFDNRLDQWLLFVPSHARQDVRSTLRDVGVGLLVREMNCSRQEAREQVETGTWTDDPVVAQFLGTSPNSSDRLRSLLDGIRFKRRVERTVRVFSHIEGECE